MALTFKKFMTSVAYLPGTMASGVADFVFGSTQKDEDGHPVLDLHDNPVTKPGLVGHLLNGVQYLTRATADFIAEHRKAIAVAGWLSLAAAGAVALTLFLWPAALTAVAGFTIGGLSIAGIVGANTMLQIGFAAGLAAAAASVGTYVTAAVANTFSAISSYFKSHSLSKAPSANAHDFTLTNNPYQKLHKSSSDLDLSDDHQNETAHGANVSHFPSPLQKGELDKKVSTPVMTPTDGTDKTMQIK